MLYPLSYEGWAHRSVRVSTLLQPLRRAPTPSARSEALRRVRR